MDKTDKRIIRVLIIFSMLFISLVVYLSYFEVFQASKIVTNHYNKRQWVNEEHVLRGIIADRNGKTLAYSEKTQDGQVRYYPFGNLYSHIIGYSLKEYGKSGLEASYNKELLNIDQNPIAEITQKITGPKEKGNNLILTIDHDLQKDAQKHLNGKKGAIILMNPKDGEIYAMVSNPDFDPSTIKDHWAEITENQNSPLINRATMGLYAPGSVFKIITATAALENDISKNFECRGSINIDGYVLRDYKENVHGKIDLKEAMRVSCNVAFARMGLELGEEILQKTCEKYMFNKKIPFDLKTKNSIFPKQMLTKPELGATAIGQGKILVTPLNMVMSASAIANDGKMMKPYLVKEILSSDGRTIKNFRPQILGSVTDEWTSEKIKDMMINVVDRGTGKKSKIRNIKVAGKTGTAENESQKEHAWFVGFAPADDPKVCVVIVLENIGLTGGSSAAPIARDLMIAALNKLK
ncbi:peptidoglycan D,D-transpeptidase FtsI family protein [Anaerophilus nitritogenes]|uniref:peptidoglycan D,D-transpeptidase FtsI family protein n=1 Tax=Anaerophilus nitritogenes TaxID=2498136 RepID=UPI00101BCB5E|nr:penicillin-binding transpeptidase domain-containing protein [Anaerophilus nitritogenes]